MARVEVDIGAHWYLNATSLMPTGSKWLEWVGKKQSVKADLATYGYINTVSG